MCRSFKLKDSVMSQVALSTTEVKNIIVVEVIKETY